MPKPPLHFHFLLLDGFSNMVLACAMEPLRATRHLHPHLELSWSFDRLGGGIATSSSGLVLDPSHQKDQNEQRHDGPYDYLVLVAGYHARHVDRAELIKNLHPKARMAKKLVGLDMGAWLWAMAGYLDGYQATLHWDELDDFEEAFLSVDLTRARYCMDRNRYSAGGASSTMSLMLDILTDEFGPAVAMDVRNLFVYDNNPVHPGTPLTADQDDTLFKGARGQTLEQTINDPVTKQALALMRAHIEDPLSLQDLSDQLAISTRSLDRAFKRVLGSPPMHYYLVMRLAIARNLAQETRLPIADIAVKSGFSSASTLSRAFTRHFGKPLKSFR